MHWSIRDLQPLGSANKRSYLSPHVWRVRLSSDVERDQAGLPLVFLERSVPDVVRGAFYGAPSHWSIASSRARRTRTSSNGFFLWLDVIRFPQFQSLSCTESLSPSLEYRPIHT